MPHFDSGEKKKKTQKPPLRQQSPACGIKTRFFNCQKQLTSLGKTPGC